LTVTPELEQELEKQHEIEGPVTKVKIEEQEVVTSLGRTKIDPLVQIENLRKENES